MPEYLEFKRTPIYRDGRREVDALINDKLKPIQLKLDRAEKALAELDQKVAALELAARQKS